MGCVSSNLLHSEDDHFPQLTSSSLSHHIVSLTSTTYGLLNLDPSPPPPPTSTTSPPTPPLRFTLSSIFPETINSWELMSGLETIDSFRFSPLKNQSLPSKEDKNIDSFRFSTLKNQSLPSKEDKTIDSFRFSPLKNQSLPSKEEKSNVHCNASPFYLDKFEKLCPPNGENRVVLYTTSLRGVRKTFEDCNVVRAMLQGFGVAVCERDVSMDKGFREELRELMKGKDRTATLPPRLFVKGRYIGGVEEVIRVVEESFMGSVLDGLPKKEAGVVCEGCGDGRFLPCFSCNGSSKMVMIVKDVMLEKKHGSSVVVRCPDCNENGLVLCPICG